MSNVAKKLASLCLESSGTAYKHHKWCPLVGHLAQPFDCAHCALCTQTLCFLLMYTTGLVRVDKQHTSKLHDNAAVRHVEYVLLEL